MRIPYIAYILGLILGGLIFGYLADHAGRKMVLLGWLFVLFFFFTFILLFISGSMWTACALSIFQLLSQDYISYVFFIFFLGFAIGAIHVIIVPYVMEMVYHCLVLILEHLSSSFSFPAILERSMVSHYSVLSFYSI